MSEEDGWIGVDLDGTLAHYEPGQFRRCGPLFIGQPIPAMLRRVKWWLEDGKTVKILTARASEPACVEAIKAWCKLWLECELEVTDRKDFNMVELWDDRAVQVVTNKGDRVGCYHCGGERK